MTNFFPSRPAAHPTIYAYEDTHPQYRGLLKVGYTSVDVQHRVAQQYPTLRPGARPYRIVFEESAMRGDGTSFTDHEVHRVLRRMGVENPEGEWFRCTVREVRRRYAPCGSSAKPNSNARSILPCAPSRRQP
ncbi:MAG: GIY-YIG nuclease family protein [Alistipes shahii]